MIQSFEKELKGKKIRREELEALTNNWNEVELGKSLIGYLEKMFSRQSHRYGKMPKGK